MARHYQRPRFSGCDRSCASLTLSDRPSTRAPFIRSMATCAWSSVDITTKPKPMQAAYWMVDGFYQSYETTNLQVELVLNVRRLLGKNQRIQVRDKPGEPLLNRC